MLIKNKLKPFPHSIVYDFYNKDEEKLIWKELEFLNKPEKMSPPLETGDPNASPNKSGMFIHDSYSNISFSNIFTINQKIFRLKPLLESNIFSNYLSVANTSEIMISYYEDKSYYEMHKDSYMLSSVITFWKKPKKFTGGNLTFNDYEYQPKMNHNTMILFPSYQNHSVSEIVMKNNDGINGRYTINHFFKVI